MKFSILNSDFVLLTSMFAFHCFNACSQNLATYAFSFLNRAFELVVCRSELVTRGFELVTRRFEFVTCGFELVSHGFELVIREVQLLTRKSELITWGAFIYYVITEG